MNAPVASTQSVVETLKTAAGIDLWLVRSPGLPLMVMDFAFPGGSRLDPADLAGLANFMSGMLDEGAGHLDSDAFQSALADHAISLRFDASRDEFRGTMRCLASKGKEAFDLLRLALTEPHFEKGAVERVRGQILAGLKSDMQSPDEICRKLFVSKAFPSHAYGWPVKGDMASVAALSSAAMKQHMPLLLQRHELKVVLVADMSAAEAAKAVDAVFGTLPVGNKTDETPCVMSGLGTVETIAMDVPQTVLRFGGIGLMRHDPDFIAATVVNHILGGSAFTSRLFLEVREKRGLAYGVSSMLIPYTQTAIHMGGTATKNERAAESLSVIRDEIQKLADFGPTAEEHEAAIQFLTGSYPLRFDTSPKIAGEYLRVALDGFGPDYVTIRNSLFERLTFEDLARTAKRLYGDGKMLVAAVGQPVDLV